MHGTTITTATTITPTTTAPKSIFPPAATSEGYVRRKVISRLLTEYRRGALTQQELEQELAAVDEYLPAKPEEREAEEVRA